MKPLERLGSVTSVDDNSSDSSHIQEFSGSIESHEDDFKHLDTSHLSPGAKKELIARLRHDRRVICKKFQDLLQISIRAFKDVPPKTLATHILCIEGTCYSTPESSFENDFERMGKAPDIAEVFLILRPYINFFNFDLLEYMIKGEQNEVLWSELQTYKKAFEQYCKRKVTESSHWFSSTSSNNQVQITMEIEALMNETTLHKVHDLQLQIGQIINAPSLQLYKIGAGSMILTFLIPSFMEDKIFPLSEEQLQNLAAIGVKKVECGDYSQVCKSIVMNMR